jgi:hypothetical protein
MTFLLRVALTFTLFAVSAASAAAQSQVRLWSIATGPAIIDANAEAVNLAAGARGLGTIGMQTSGTFEGTIALQCSNDQTTWTALRITPPNTTTAVTSVTTEGMWVGSMAGCQYVRAVSTAWTSGAAIVSLFATSAGGGAGGGAVTFEGEISAFNGVLLDAPTGDSLTDTTNDALRVNIVAGSPTVTANLGAVDNAVLDDIAAKVGHSSRSDTYTEAGNGTAVNVSTNPRQWFGVQVKGTGASATSWTVNLQASLDGTNYSTVLTHANTTDTDGSIAWISTPAPALYFRSSVSAVVLGSATNIVVTIVGMP